MVVAGVAQDRWARRRGRASSHGASRSASASAASVVGSSGGRRRRVDHPDVGPARRAQPCLPRLRRRGDLLGQWLRRRVRRRPRVRRRHPWRARTRPPSSPTPSDCSRRSSCGSSSGRRSSDRSCAAACTLRPILYAVVSLTVVRMLPVAISLVGERLRPMTVGFIGWFGPRGLASVVFTLIAFDALGGHASARTWPRSRRGRSCCQCVAHGLSSGPLAALYGRRLRPPPPTHPSWRRWSRPGSASAACSEVGRCRGCGDVNAQEMLEHRM